MSLEQDEWMVSFSLPCINVLNSLVALLLMSLDHAM